MNCFLCFFVLPTQNDAVLSPIANLIWCYVFLNVCAFFNRQKVLRLKATNQYFILNVLPLCGRIVASCLMRTRQNLAVLMSLQLPRSWPKKRSLYRYITFKMLLRNCEGNAAFPCKHLLMNFNQSTKRQNPPFIVRRWLALCSALTLLFKLCAKPFVAFSAK